MSVLIWLGVTILIAWTWKRHIALMVGSGVQIDAKDQQMSSARIPKRHMVGWSAAFFAVFLLLELADVPLWWLLLFCRLLAIVYGSSEIGRGEQERVAQSDAGELTLFCTVARYDLVPNSRDYGLGRVFWDSVHGKPHFGNIGLVDQGLIGNPEKLCR